MGRCWVELSPSDAQIFIHRKLKTKVENGTLGILPPETLGNGNQGTYRSLLYPFIYIETENGKAPTSVLLFYCFETVKGLDTLFYFIASQ